MDSRKAINQFETFLQNVDHPIDQVTQNDENKKEHSLFQDTSIQLNFR